MSNNEHVPVLRDAAVAALCVRPGGHYIDATFGRGGHSAEILRLLGDSGHLVMIDRDPEAIAVARSGFGDDRRCTVIHGRFANLELLLTREYCANPVDGILLDLGVSSPQLEDARRGFSFRQEGPLDMRMDPGEGEALANWLRVSSRERIAEVLVTYGEERFAKRIANAIVAAREQAPLETTSQLAEICARAVPTREPGKHPATRTFQALRIVLNEELEELTEVLPQARDRLRPGGRLAVISFHSLEDRIVKRFIRGTHVPRRLRRLPAAVPPPPLRAVGKAVRPTADEVRINPRARSAVLRVAERAA